MSSAVRRRAGGLGHVRSSTSVAGAHADYHREIQQHAEPDGLVDDVVTYRMLAPHLMRTLLFLVVPTVLLLVKARASTTWRRCRRPTRSPTRSSRLLGVLIVVLYLAGHRVVLRAGEGADRRVLPPARGPRRGRGSRLRWVRAAAADPAAAPPRSAVDRRPACRCCCSASTASARCSSSSPTAATSTSAGRCGARAPPRRCSLHFLRDTFGRFAPAPALLRRAARRRHPGPARERALAVPRGRRGRGARHHPRHRAPPPGPDLTGGGRPRRAEAPAWHADRRDAGPAPTRTGPSTRRAPAGRGPAPLGRAAHRRPADRRPAGVDGRPDGHRASRRARGGPPQRRPGVPPDGWGPPPRDRW